MRNLVRSRGLGNVYKSRVHKPIATPPPENPQRGRSRRDPACGGRTPRRARKPPHVGRMANAEMIAATSNGRRDETARHAPRAHQCIAVAQLRLRGSEERRGEARGAGPSRGSPPEVFRRPGSVEGLLKSSRARVRHPGHLDAGPPRRLAAVGGLGREDVHLVPMSRQAPRQRSDEGPTVVSLEARESGREKTDLQNAITPR